MLKKVLVITILLVFLLTGFVSALSIDTQDYFAENTQWSFIVDFSSLSNEESGQIFLDNENLLNVFQYNNTIFIDDSSISSRIVSYKLNNKEVTISLVGFSKSTREILVKRIGNGSVVNEVSKTIDFVELVTKSEQDRLRSELGALESKVRILENNIDEKNETISGLQRENAKLLSDLQNLNANIRLLEQDGKSKEEIISQVKSDLDILLIEREEARNSPLNSLFVFGLENSSSILVLFLLVALIVVGLFVKSRKTSIYDTPIFDNEENYVLPEEKNSGLGETKRSPFKDFFEKRFAKKETVPDSSNSNKGKWAAESYFPQREVKSSNEEDKKFDLGDLIKK